MKPFAYFEDPTHPLSSWSAEPTTCSICRCDGPAFNGPFYGLDDDVEHVCETCLRSGRLEELELSTCEGDRVALKRQLAESADLSTADANRLSRERTAALEHRTPGLTTWQDMMWPAHCGDYCRFVEELGQPEIIQLAGAEDPSTWLAHRADGADADLFQYVRQRSARRYPTESYDLTVYRFVCLNCAANVIHWDAS